MPNGTREVDSESHQGSPPFESAPHAESARTHSKSRDSAAIFVWCVCVEENLSYPS